MAKDKPPKKKSFTERNRQNAKNSTGPKTAKGKAASARNAVKHGMTADPSSGAVPDDGSYQQIFSEVADLLKPVGTPQRILAGIAAKNLWQLQRAIAYEQAIVKTQKDRGLLDFDRINHWIDEILKRFQRFYRKTMSFSALGHMRRDPVPNLDSLNRTDPDAVRMMKALDERMNKEVLTHLPGAAAVHILLGNYKKKLENKPRALAPKETQILSWILYAPGAKWEPNPPGREMPQKESVRTEEDRRLGIDSMIGVAVTRDLREPCPEDLCELIELRIEQLNVIISQLHGAWDTADSLTSVPAEGHMNLIHRYEERAIRGCERSLDLLAKMKKLAQPEMAEVRRLGLGPCELPANAPLTPSMLNRTHLDRSVVEKKLDEWVKLIQPSPTHNGHSHNLNDRGSKPDRGSAE